MEEYARLVEKIKKAVRGKVLQGYRNGQAAGPEPAPARGSAGEENQTRTPGLAHQRHCADRSSRARCAGRSGSPLSPLTRAGNHVCPRFLLLAGSRSGPRAPHGVVAQRKRVRAYVRVCCVGLLAELELVVVDLNDGSHTSTLTVASKTCSRSPRLVARPTVNNHS
jgi:hypothetical protein